MWGGGEWGELTRVGRPRKDTGGGAVGRDKDTGTGALTKVALKFRAMAILRGDWDQYRRSGLLPGTFRGRALLPVYIIHAISIERALKRHLLTCHRLSCQIPNSTLGEKSLPKGKRSRRYSGTPQLALGTEKPSWTGAGLNEPGQSASLPRRICHNLNRAAAKSELLLK